MSIAAASRRVLIANSYVVPDALMVETLLAAIQRGVMVEIIVPGRHIDTKVTRRASRSMIGPLLQAGANIYEFQPTMFHCKVMIIDDRWVSVGSANFDTRSFRLNDEANLNVLDGQFATEQARIFESDKANSRQITLKVWQQRPWHEKGARLVGGFVSIADVTTVH